MEVKFCNVCRRVVLIFLICVLFFVLAELLFRCFPKVHYPDGCRTYQPFFVSGHYFYALKNVSQLERHSWEGPSKSGYRSRNGVYLYYPKEALDSVTPRFDWILMNEFSRYSPEQIDNLSQRATNSIRIFVLGGSTAMGTHASNKEATWDARLERKLRHRFARPDIHVFNAAVGAFSSTQERLAFELVVEPRHPDIVITLNGINDVLLPITYGARPGDPYHTGLRYAEHYERSLATVMGRWSRLVNHLRSGVLTARAMKKHSDRILADREQADIFSSSIVRIYSSNMDKLLERCHEERICCLIFLQPWRDLSRSRAGMTPVDQRLFAFAREAYLMIPAHFVSSSNNSSFVDLSNAMSSEEACGFYTDQCHLNDMGQARLADAVFPGVAEAVTRVINKRQ